MSSKDDIIKTLFSAVTYYGQYKETYYAGCLNHALAMILQKISITPRIKSNSAKAGIGGYDYEDVHGREPVHLCFI